MASVDDIVSIEMIRHNCRNIFTLFGRGVCSNVAVCTNRVNMLRNSHDYASSVNLSIIIIILINQRELIAKSLISIACRRPPGKITKFETGALEFKCNRSEMWEIAAIASA